MIRPPRSDAELSGLISWADDGVEALDSGDRERVRRDLLAIRAWLTARVDLASTQVEQGRSHILNQEVGTQAPTGR